MKNFDSSHVLYSIPVHSQFTIHSPTYIPKDSNDNWCIIFRALNHLCNNRSFVNLNIDAIAFERLRIGHYIDYLDVTLWAHDKCSIQ